jgi:hypothetical protein
MTVPAARRLNPGQAIAFAAAMTAAAFVLPVYGRVSEATHVADMANLDATILEKMEDAIRQFRRQSTQKNFFQDTGLPNDINLRLEYPDLGGLENPNLGGDGQKTNLIIIPMDKFIREQEKVSGSDGITETARGFFSNVAEHLTGLGDVIKCKFTSLSDLQAMAAQISLNYAPPPRPPVWGIVCRSGGPIIR